MEKKIIMIKKSDFNKIIDSNTTKLLMTNNDNFRKDYNSIKKYLNLQYIISGFVTLDKSLSDIRSNIAKLSFGIEFDNKYAKETGILKTKCNKCGKNFFSTAFGYKKEIYVLESCNQCSDNDLFLKLYEGKIQR